MLCSAAMHPYQAEGLVKMLTQHSGSRQTSETVVETALANETAALELIKLFSENKSLKVTDRVTKAAARSESCGQQLIEFLIASHPEDVQATEAVLKVAAANGQQGHRVVQALLKKRKREITTDSTEGVRTRKVEISIDITEGVLKAAVMNEGPAARGIFRLLLDHGARGFVTEAVMKAIAGNRSNGRDLVWTLISHDEVSGRSQRLDYVTTKVLSIAAANRDCGFQVLLKILFLDREVKEEIILAAASSERQGTDVIRYLIQTRGSNLPMTEEVYEAARQNIGCGKDILHLLEKWELSDYTG